jgi:hypothetical protein
MSEIPGHSGHGQTYAGSTRSRMSLRGYLKAIGEAFDGGIDYAMLVKIYDNDSASSPERRYSPQPASALKRRRSLVTLILTLSARHTLCVKT